MLQQESAVVLQQKRAGMNGVDEEFSDTLESMRSGVVRLEVLAHSTFPHL